PAGNLLRSCTTSGSLMRCDRSRPFGDRRSTRSPASEERAITFPRRLERMTMGTRKPRPVNKSSTKRSAPAMPGRNGDAPQVILLLQGGGALGAYHIGAYQALHESG